VAAKTQRGCLFFYGHKSPSKKNGEKAKEILLIERLISLVRLNG